MGNKNIFAEAKRVLDDVQREEEKVKVRRQRKRQWNETHVEYQQRIRRETREVRLDQRVPDRVCPVCLKTKLRSRQWVLLDRRTLAVKCARAEVPEAVTEVLVEHAALCLGCNQKLFRGK